MGNKSAEAAEAAETELKVKLQKTQTELEHTKQQIEAHELTVNAATAKAAEVLKEKPNLKAAAAEVAGPVETDEAAPVETDDTTTSEYSPVGPTDQDAEDDSLNELLLQSKYSTSVRRQSLENASPRVEAEIDMLMDQAQVDKSTEAAKAQVDIMHQRTVEAVQAEVAKLMRGGVVVEELARAHQDTVEELAQAIKLAEEAASVHRGAEHKLDAMHAATEAAVKLDLFNERPRPSGSPPRRRSPTRPLKTVDQLCVDARVSLAQSQSPTGPRPVEAMDRLRHDQLTREEQRAVERKAREDQRDCERNGFEMERESGWRPTVVIDQMRCVSKQVHLDNLPKWRYTDPVTGEDHYE